MTDIQGALGCAQMARADWILERRRELAARYDELLAGIEWLRTPVTPAGDVHGYQAYVCLFAPEEPSLENVDECTAAATGSCSPSRNRGSPRGRAPTPPR